MKKYLVFLLLAALAVSCSKPAPATETVAEPVEVIIEEKTALPEPDTLEERFAYVYGYQLLNSIIAQMPELDSAYFAEGVRAYVDNDFSYTMAESQEIMNEYQQKRYESYEAEMNVIIHAGGGNVAAEVFPEATVITVTDKGPGIPDINKALQEGWSTAPDYVRQMGFGAGMGLPNMQKCSDEFDIQSKVGEGTTIVMKFKHQIEVL